MLKHQKRTGSRPVVHRSPRAPGTLCSPHAVTEAVEGGAGALVPDRLSPNRPQTLPHLQELLVCKCHDAFKDNHVGAIEGFL